jgi:hypothetical protein
MFCKRTIFCVSYGSGRSVGIVRSRTKATEFSLVLVLYVDTHSDISDYSGNESLDTDSDVQQLVHVNNCKLLLVH